jgi:hypothetical protein
MKNPKRENFKLTKIKLSGGAVEISYTLQEVIGGDTYKSNQMQKSTKNAHPDLEENLFAMAPMVAQILCFTNARDIALKKEFKADAYQKECMAKYVDYIVEKFMIYGIAISGEDGKRGVQIVTGFAVDNNQRTTITTPKILFSGESRGFEEKLEEMVATVEREAFEFVYNGKVANPEMFDYEEGEEQEEQEEIPVEKED